MARGVRGGCHGTITPGSHAASRERLEVGPDDIRHPIGGGRLHQARAALPSRAPSYTRRVTTDFVIQGLTPLDERCLEIGPTLQRRPLTAVQLLQCWTSLVTEAELNIILSIWDYENDLDRRDYIEAVLQDERAMACFDAGWWSARIAEQDARLRALFRDDVEIEGQHWWDRGVLVDGGETYRADVLESRLVVPVTKQR